MDSTFDTGLTSNSRKAMIFAIIVGFHVLLVWGLVTTLGIIQVDRPPPPIIAEILEEILEEEELPPPPPAIETPPPMFRRRISSWMSRSPPPRTRR